MIDLVRFIVLFIILFEKECYPLLHNCKPRDSLVSTCSYRGSYIPPYVELKRCIGGINDPLNHHCQATKVVQVPTHVMDQHGDPLTVKLDNHLECEEVCVCGYCGGNKSHPVCEQGYVWDESRCKCICTCESNMVSNTDQEVTTNGFSSTQLILIMIAELFAICIALFVGNKSLRYYTKYQRSKSIYQTTTVSYNTLKTDL